jgi:transposase
MKPISAEVRAEVLAACDAKEGTRVVAVRFNVSESWVRRVKQRRRETGQVRPQTTPPQEPKWKDWADWLIAKVTARPDIYLRELQAELKAERGEEVCLMTICNACRALELTRKKRRSSPASRIGRMSPSNASSGARRKTIFLPTKPFLSTKPGRKRT